MLDNLDVGMTAVDRQSQLTNRVNSTINRTKTATDLEINMPAAVDASNAVLTLGQVIESPDTARLLSQIDDEGMRRQITIERIRMRDEYRIGVINNDEFILNRDSAIQHVESGDSIGQTLIDIEQRTINLALENIRSAGGVIG